jgi:hypothetical protein
MRLRIILPLDGCIDGIELNVFEPGCVYDVGTLLGCYLLAIQAAVPADNEPLSLPPRNLLFGTTVQGWSARPKAPRPASIEQHRTRRTRRKTG